MLNIGFFSRLYRYTTDAAEEESLRDGSLSDEGVFAGQ